MRLTLLCCFALACDPHDGDDDTDVRDADAVFTELDPDVAPIPPRGVRIARWASWQDGIANGVHADVVVLPLAEVTDAALGTVTSSGAVALCRFSVATGYAPDWPAELLGNDTVDGAWLDIRASAVQAGMESRIVRAAALGCDGVLLTHADVTAHDTGLPLTELHQRAYARWLSNAVRIRGLAVAIETDADDVTGYADAVLLTDCLANDACHADASLALWNVEVSNTPEDTCREALIAGTRTHIVTEGGDVSCDTDFPAATRLSDVRTYATYYGADPVELQALGGLDLAIVQPLLSADQLARLKTRTQVVAYLSIGEIGLSNTYLIDGEELPGQVVYDAHPEWFLAQNPWFDSWFANTNDIGWQDFVLDQAQQLMDQGYDGIFMDTVDTVDVYPDTLPGMATLISRLRDQHPDARIVQNRGMNVIPVSGPDVDALMFEVFSTRHDHETGGYAPTDTEAPGYAQIVDNAVEYRLSGGVVLAQDFAEPGGEWDALICAARERAKMHGFLPAFADAFFQDGPFPVPASCPWPDAPRAPIRLDPPIVHAAAGDIVTAYITTGVPWRVEPHATLDVATDGPQLTLTIPPSATAGNTHITVNTDDGPVRLPVDVHDRTVWVANAGLSNVVAFDEPTASDGPARPDRTTASPVAQPYALDVDADGTLWVAENVGSPDAPQPAGRVLGFDAFDLSEPMGLHGGLPPIRGPDVAGEGQGSRRVLRRFEHADAHDFHAALQARILDCFKPLELRSRRVPGDGCIDRAEADVDGDITHRRFEHLRVARDSFPEPVSFQHRSCHLPRGCSLGVGHRDPDSLDHEIIEGVDPTWIALWNGDHQLLRGQWNHFPDKSPLAGNIEIRLLRCDVEITLAGKFKIVQERPRTAELELDLLAHLLLPVLGDLDKGLLDPGGAIDKQWFRILRTTMDSRGYQESRARSSGKSALITVRGALAPACTLRHRSVDSSAAALGAISACPRWKPAPR